MVDRGCGDIIVPLPKVWPEVLNGVLAGCVAEPLRVGRNRAMPARPMKKEAKQANEGCNKVPKGG